MEIVAAVAHPDDETIMIGGTLAMLAGRGARVHLVSATRGEGGELGEPPLCSREALGTVRERELHCAAKALGAATVTFLDHVDPPEKEDGGLDAFPASPEYLASQIKEILRQHRSGLLITHGSEGEYGHPAHQLMHQAALLVGRNDVLNALYTFSAQHADHPRPRLANINDPADYVIAIDPWFSQKWLAAQCHQTQHALFLRRQSQEAGRSLTLADVLMRNESLHRSWSSGPANWRDPLAEFMIEKCADAVTLAGKTQL
jgi:LmbE family N-acetylglucosaminyl deacetylase